MSRKLKTAVFLPFALILASCSSNVLEPSGPDNSSLPSAGYYSLPKGLVTLRVLQDGSQYALNYVKTQYVPDPDYLVPIRYNPDTASYDKVNITTTKNGLLLKVEVTSEEKSGEIVVKLVDLAKEVARAATVFPGAKVIVAGATVTEVLSAELDPTNPTELSSWNERIKKFGLRTELRRLVGVERQAPAVQSEGSGRCGDGICFRPLISYELAFKGVPGETEEYSEAKGVVLQTQTVLLPNNAPVLSVSVTRAPFVKKVTNLSFEEGLLTGVSIDKPSESLAFMDLPLALVRAIVALPTELIQLKIDTSTKEKQLFDARKSEIEARQQLLEYQRQLLQAAPGSGPPP